MSSGPRYGSDVPPGGLVDALDRAGRLVVTGMLHHEMHESVKRELASHLAAAAVADDPDRALPDRGATGREPDPRGFTDFRASNGATFLGLEAIAGTRSGDPPRRKSLRPRCRRARSLSASAGRCVGADRARGRRP